MRILITGGAGFIGSNLAVALLNRGHDVIVYDSFDSQVHGQIPKWGYGNLDGLQVIRADIRDRGRIAKLLTDSSPEAIVHLASAVGVGQSMYQIRRYVDVNSLGTANLLQALIDTRNTTRRLVVASSMSIYGEGSYSCEEHGEVYPMPRAREQLERNDWELHCPYCEFRLKPVATSETKPLAPTSIYATTKRDQEEMVLQYGEAYGIESVALRYFNVYGPGQALSNPYTGLIAIFSSRLRTGNRPVIFEDGNQTRDFVHVSDVVRANVLALESAGIAGRSFNIGTGRPCSVIDVAKVLSKILGINCGLDILGQYRAGDIRHCYADNRLAQQVLGMDSYVKLEDGIAQLFDWLRNQVHLEYTDAALAELRLHKLVSTSD